MDGWKRKRVKNETEIDIICQSFQINDLYCHFTSTEVVLKIFQTLCAVIEL